MECCRICLATNGLTNIFETEETASNIAAIACVDISQDDGLPQYICLLCKHELDISISFKDKCESTFEMLKEQHAKEIEVKESIILNLLSGGNAMDNKLPETTRKCILNTVINSVKNKTCNDGENVDNDVFVESDNETLFIGEEEESNIIYNEEISEEEVESVTSLENHSSTRTDVDDQMTDITEIEFEMPESLKLRNQGLWCVKCNFFFVNKKCLFDHIQRIHPKTMEQCQICLLHFPTGQVLREHLREKHDVSDDSENVFMCKACNKSFRFQSELNGHRCSRSRPNGFWCELCQTNEFSRSDYCKRNHRGNHTKIYSDLSNSESQIELLCSKCNACFLSHEELKKHIIMCCTRKGFSEKEELYKCNTCDKSFAQSANLTAHQRTHKFIKSHVCSICKMEFYKQNSLEKHLLKHNSYIKCTREETYVQCEDEETA